MTEIQGEIVELKGPLTDEQEQRAAALRVAREALQIRDLFGGSVLPGRGSGELVYLAEWILIGPQEDDEPDEEVRASIYSQAIDDAIRVTVEYGETEIASKIRDLLPNADEAPTS